MISPFRQPRIAMGHPALEGDGALIGSSKAGTKCSLAMNYKERDPPRDIIPAEVPFLEILPCR